MKTEAEIQAEIEKKAEEHLKQERGDTQEYIELSFREGQLPRSFKQGVTLGREIEREQMREFVKEVSEIIYNPRYSSQIAITAFETIVTKYQATRGDDHE